MSSRRTFRARRQGRSGFGRRASLRQTTVLAEASSVAELRTVTPSVAVIPEGATGEVRVRGFWGLGFLADLPGAEIVWKQLFNPQGLDVIDVHGEGSRTAVVDWANPTSQSQAGGYAPHRIGPLAVIAIIGAVALALAVLGWAVSKITILMFGTSGPEGGLVGAFGGVGFVVVGGLIAAYLISSQRKGSKAT